MRRRGVWLGVSLAAIVAVLLFVLAKGFGRDPHEVPFQLRGKPAPDFTLRRLDTGVPVKLSELKGKPIVLNFWASWCAPCKMEHPVVTMAARRYGQDFQFFGVVFEDTEENARAFAGASDPSFPQLFDERSRMAVDYGVTGVPETYFIDAQGILRDKVAYPIDPRTMAEKLTALKQPAGPVSEVVR
jgi:cytochrome c biogenesis protein CcmG, thiol:disulfide interchange protein DsbE